MDSKGFFKVEVYSKASFFEEKSKSIYQFIGMILLGLNLEEKDIEQMHLNFI